MYKHGLNNPCAAGNHCIILCSDMQPNILSQVLFSDTSNHIRLLLVSQSGIQGLFFKSSDKLVHLYVCECFTTHFWCKVTNSVYACVDGLLGMGILGGAVLVGGALAAGAVALAGMGIAKLAKK